MTLSFLSEGARKTAGKIFRNRASRLAVGAGLMLVAAACRTNEFTYATTVSGGERLRFTIAAGRPAPAEQDGVEVFVPGLLPNVKLKKVVMGFAVSDKNPAHKLRHIRVEDVSESTPLLIIDDDHPELIDHLWHHLSRPLDDNDPALKWISYVDDSVRVYRFTIEFADGRKVVLHQVSVIPGWQKAAVRHLFGEKY